MSAHCWIPLYIQSQWSSQVCQKKKKKNKKQPFPQKHCHFSVLEWLAGLCVLHTDKTPKILIHFVFTLKWRIFIVLLFVLFTVQSVTWDCFTLCCVEYLSFCLSVGTMCRLVPCEVGIQRPSLVLWTGAHWLMKSLLHRGRHYDSVYGAMYRSDGHFWWDVSTLTVYIYINSADIVSFEAELSPESRLLWGQTGVHPGKPKLLYWIVYRRKSSSQTYPCKCPHNVYSFVLTCLSYAAAPTWLAIQHVVLSKYKISKRYVKVLCFMDQFIFNISTNLILYISRYITLFLMQNNFAVFSISTTVANLALSKSQFL